MYTPSTNNIELDQGVIKRIIQAITVAKIWAGEHLIEISLFGSYAKGTQRKFSSIDLLVIVDESKERFIRRKAELEKILNEDDQFPLVDPLVYTEEELIDLIHKKESFIDSVLNEAILIWSKDQDIDLEKLNTESIYPSRYKGASPKLEKVTD